jgi:hypothetical protein
MPGALSFISKGDMLSRVDEAYKAPTHEMLEQLKDPKRPLSDTAVGLKILIGNGDLKHAAEFLENADGAWWEDVKEKESIVRCGYVKALENALQYWPPKPVVSYWVTGVEAFEVVVSETPQEVQVFLLTPTHPPIDRPRGVRLRPVTEQLWVISTEDKLDDRIRKPIRAAGLTPDPAEEFQGFKKVRAQRLVGY